MNEKNISLIGGGLVGSLLSILLAKRGFNVTIIEKRSDLRVETISAGRSINLALAYRGIYALKEAGLLEEVKKILIPMRGRMLHDELGKLTFLKYSQNENEKIFSVSRKTLNSLLLDKAESTGKVKVLFNHSVKSVNFDTKEITLYNEKEYKSQLFPFNILIGTDGINSRIRKEILNLNAFENSEDVLDHSYKELHIPPLSDNKFQMEREALHIWPRNEFMQIALPNTDGSFTVTLFLANQGNISFESIKNKEILLDFYSRYFKDSISLIPNLTEDFFSNPTGKLTTIKCLPWHYKDFVLVMGDAAHGIVPFHGQGMNCGFEDCSELLKLIDKHSNWKDVFEEYQTSRKPDCDAIADLAIDNYMEMRSSVNQHKFQLKKELSFKFEELFPDYFVPRYSMVMFHKIPYSLAKQRGEIQNKILEDCLHNKKNIDEVDLVQAKTLICKNLTQLEKAYDLGV